MNDLMTHARTFTAALLALSIIGYSDAQTVRCTTWNLQWFPNGSTNQASAEGQNQRIKGAADVLRPINPDIILLQEVRDYEACARLGEAIVFSESNSAMAARRALQACRR